MAYISHIPHVAGTLAKAADVNANDTETRNVVNGQLDTSNFTTTLTGTLIWVMPSANPVFKLTGNSDSIIEIIQNTQMASGDAIIKITDSANQLSSSGVLGGLYYNASGSVRTAPVFNIANGSLGTTLFANHSSTAHFVDFQASGTTVFRVEDSGLVYSGDRLQVGSDDADDPILYRNAAKRLLISDRDAAGGVSLQLDDVTGPIFSKSAANRAKLENELELGAAGLVLSSGSSAELVVSGADIRLGTGGPEIYNSGGNVKTGVSMEIGGSLTLGSTVTISNSSGSLYSDSQISSPNGFVIGSSGVANESDNKWNFVNGIRLNTNAMLTSSSSTNLQVSGRSAIVGPSGAINLVLVRGTCNSADTGGSKAYGEGFTSTHIGGGVIQITFTTAFSSVPSATVTVNSVDPGDTATLVGRDPTFINVLSGATAKAFDFIAVGPR